MLHGNPLLRGWTVSDVSFYTTELPQYALIELVRGLRADVVDIAAAMTYTLVVLLAALLAKGIATGWPGLVRVAIAGGILLAPQLDLGTNVLLSSPDHTGTAVPLLLTWLLIDRAGPQAGGRSRWWLPVATSLLLCWAQAADSIVLVAGIIPLAVVCTVRAAAALTGRPARPGGRAEAAGELAMAGGALAAGWAASAILRAVTAAGGFTVRPLGTALGPLNGIVRHNLPLAARCLLVLFGAESGGPSTAEEPAFLLLHLAGVGLAVAGVAVAAGRLARRLPGRGGRDVAGKPGVDKVSQVLLTAIVVNCGAFLVTQRVVDLSSAREIAPVLPFAAVLAARQLAPVIGLAVSSAVGPRFGPSRTAEAADSRTAEAAGLRRLLGRVLILTGTGYLAGLGVELAAPAAPPQGAQLTAWLSDHQLGGTGLGGYWQASVVTLTSGGSVAVRPVADSGDGIGPHRGEVNRAWFDPRQSAARYLVLTPGTPEYPGYSDGPVAAATWGVPARIYHVGQYTIWYWPKNLLPALRPSPAGD